MPTRRSATGGSSGNGEVRGDFRQRYDDVENKRVELLARLNQLGDKGRSHPGHQRALKLLNDTFRRSKLTQRVAVLQAAAWLIYVLEQVASAL